MKFYSSHRAILAILVSSTLLVCFQPTHAANYPATVGGAQDPVVSADRARGIELYEKGDDGEAVKALSDVVKQRPDDLGAWYYLGLAFERQRKTGDAGKAFEKAANLGDAVLTAQSHASSVLGAPLALPPINLPLRQAAQSATKYIQLAKPSKSQLDEWTARAAYLHDLAEMSEPSNPNPALHVVFKNRDVTAKARVLAKPLPRYTEDARQHQISGIVVLRCIFAADGTVRAVFPIKPLPQGLTLEAIMAARQIKFIPAIKDGHPVSTFLQIEYNFDIN